jgi:PTH1 family peptidyl-tRNA hydrolase
VKVAAGIQLIVGLGNPGAKYEDTRHNAGAWFVSALASDNDISLRKNAKFHGLHAQTEVKGHECHLLIPTTYMNLSGQAVQAVADYYKISPASILIAHDELDLSAGTVRLKFDGGHGGHNGLKDIISHLNTKQFYRLRIGIGHPGNRDDVVDYVLKNPSQADRLAIITALQEAEPILPLIMQGEFQKAMHLLHSDNTKNAE